MEEIEVYKECPNCTVMTEKSHGCNKMDCPQCECVWCFYCGARYLLTKRKKKNTLYCVEPEKHKDLPVTE